MPKKVKVFAAGLFLAIIGIACFALFAGKAHGEWDETYEPFEGNGWSMTADGVMTIESNEGWIDCLKYGIQEKVNELVIGKDVTNFRMYDLPRELPTPDFFSKEDILGYDASGRPHYDYPISINLLPLKISVEEGNTIFRVIDGLLINMETHELVLAELGVYDVVIPEGVKSITCKAFESRRVHTVQFPSTITTIGESAFLSCQNLKGISLPDTIKEIGVSAFDNCNNLSDVKLPADMTTIAIGAFDSCAIQYIEIPSSVRVIGNAAFARCKRLQQVVIRGRVTEIGIHAFYGCNALSLIQLPEGLEFIGKGSFERCENLRTMILPDSLQQIGPDAFKGCSLSLLSIPESLVIPVYDDLKNEYIVNPYAKTEKSFDLSSADTVILSGSDYDFGYPAISNAKNVYFLGKPPEDVGQILDEDSVGKIYCSDEFEFEWTRSTIASWVRQKLTILPAAEIKAFAEEAVNTTPVPTNTPTPKPSQSPTPTPWPTPMPRPTVSPAANAEPEQKPIDPILFVFAGVIALVFAGIVALALQKHKAGKKGYRSKNAREK